MIKKIKEWLTVAALVLSIMGLVTFSLFIMEESLQTVMFGTWAAQDAGRWDIVKQGCNLNRRINRSMKTLNYSLGWIQPFAFISYRAYGQSMDFYIQSLEAKTLAHAPELFEGEAVAIDFRGQEARYFDGYALLVNKPLGVIVHEPPSDYRLMAKGVLTRKDDLLVVDMRD